jgi:hypothetical protein
MDLKSITVYGLGSSDLKLRQLADCFQHGSETLIPQNTADLLTI